MTLREVVDGIYQHRGLLGKQIQEGDAKACSVASLYNAAIKCPDPGSVALLIKAFQDWYVANNLGQGGQGYTSGHTSRNTSGMHHSAGRLKGGDACRHYDEGGSNA